MENKNEELNIESRISELSREYSNHTKIHKKTAGDRKIKRKLV